jgi:hypothetical protein
VKDDAGLPNLCKVQAAPNDQIEKIIRCESSAARRVEMIAGDKKFLLSIRGDEGSAFRIVLPTP